jgi:undecaprenyl diphosphate synthase
MSRERTLTLFAFSSDNWRRPEQEMSMRMSPLRQYLWTELARLVESGIRLRGALLRRNPVARFWHRTSAAKNVLP